jgi:hypothetical protein
MVGEHLNEATITRLGSILECGNMSSHLDCRAAVAHGRRFSEAIPMTIRGRSVGGLWAYVLLADLQRGELNPQEYSNTDVDLRGFVRVSP